MSDAYLKRTAQSVENYNSVDIFTIPIYGRSFRIAILGVDTVAASNHDDPAVIRGMVDRSRRLASPFGGPALLRQYYKRVQLASPVWMVAHVEPSAPGFRELVFVFPKPADLVISASYNPLHLPLRTGALHLRAEASAGNDEDARSIADKAEGVSDDVSQRGNVGGIAGQRCRRESSVRQPAGSPGRQPGRAVCDGPPTASFASCWNPRTRYPTSARSQPAKPREAEPKRTAPVETPSSQLNRARASYATEC